MFRVVFPPQFSVLFSIVAVLVVFPDDLIK